MSLITREKNSSEFVRNSNTHTGPWSAFGKSCFFDPGTNWSCGLIKLKREVSRTAIHCVSITRPQDGGVCIEVQDLCNRSTQLSPCLPCPIIQAPALRKECRQLHILVGLVSIETRKLGPGGQCCRINYSSGSQVLKDRWNGPRKSRWEKRIQDFCQHIVSHHFTINVKRRIPNIIYLYIIYTQLQVSSPTFTTVPVLSLMLYSPPIPSCDSFSPPDRWIRWRGMACSWLLRSAGDLSCNNLNPLVYLPFYTS